MSEKFGIAIHVCHQQNILFIAKLLNPIYDNKTFLHNKICHMISIILEKKKKSYRIIFSNTKMLIFVKYIFHKKFGK